MFTKLKESNKYDFSVLFPPKLLLLVTVSSGWQQPLGVTLLKFGVNIPKTSPETLLSRSLLLNFSPFFNTQFPKEGHVCSVRYRRLVLLSGTANQHS